jgi:hypothetical protein
MNRWSLAFLMWCFPLGAEEGGLLLPVGSSGTVTTGQERATIRYPFGRVEVPLEAIHQPTPDVIVTGKAHGRTRGTFRLSYALARTGNAFAPQRVRVWVENEAEYLAPTTAKLREHEAMHQRINTLQAKKIEASLRTFRREAATPAEAERLFKAAFRKQVEAVNQLHADWDDNHVFVRPSSAPTLEIP